MTWWRQLASDAGAPYDDRVELDAATIEPTVTWGINPGQSVSIGSAYNVAAFGPAGGNLTFKYGVPGHPLLTAAVVFVSGSPATAA